jgi:hypothetical protein
MICVATSITTAGLTVASAANGSTGGASAAYARSLQGVAKNSNQVLDLFREAVRKQPQAVLSLMEVAHRAAPDRCVDVARIALEEAAPDGNNEAVSKILAKAISLCPEKRTALEKLSRELYADRSSGILEGVRIILVGAPSGLGSSINPANIGGGVTIKPQIVVEDDDDGGGTVNPPPPPPPPPNPPPPPSPRR